MVMKFQKAKKSQAKLRLGLIGPSGSGEDLHSVKPCEWSWRKDSCG